MVLLVGSYKTERSLGKLTCFTAEGVKDAAMGDHENFKVIVSVKRGCYLTVKVKMKVCFVLFILVFVKSAAHIMKLGSVNVI